MSPSPTRLHQVLVLAVAMYLKQVIPGGEVYVAPLDVHIGDGEVVQPDVFWISENNDRCVLVNDQYWRGSPDLIVEILSPSTEGLDWREKFDLYEKHGVKAYWLVSQTYSVHVFRLEDSKFARQGVFGLDDKFVSQILGEVEVDVRKLLDQ